MSKFQIVLLVVFGAFILIAVILFSRNRGAATNSTALTIWGSVSAYDFGNLLNASGLSKPGLYNFTYTEKAADTIDQDFTEALAEGKGPDLIVLPVENLIKEKNKLLLLPSTSIKPSDYASTFIKEGELFQTAEGTYALPMFVDPLVLYYNRDLFSSASIAKPLVYWDQIYDYINKLTKKDNAGNIIQSALALGESKNIPNAKDIVSLLMLQAGTPITSYLGSVLRSALLDGNGGAQNSASSAFEFYTQFADPQKSYYTWNKSLLSADTSFASGKSAMYIGFASERAILKAKNPTLDFAISPVPQSRASGKVITFGHLYGVAVVRTTLNPAAALGGASALVSKGAVAALAAGTSYVPARLDLLSMTPTDPAGFVFYGAALQSRGWLDPDAMETKKIWSDTVESLISGRSRLDEAIANANNSLNALLTKKSQ